MALAGALAAALGFAAAWWVLSEDGPLAGPRLAAIEARLQAADDRLAKVETIAGAAQSAADGAASAADLQALSGRVDELEKAIASAETAQGQMSARLEELRQRPAESDPEAVAAYERELAAMREMLDGELQKIRAAAQKAAAVQTEAAAASNEAAVMAALSGIDTALDTGAPFGAALDQLAGLDPGLPVAPLRPYADGVETLAALQRDFPPAARAAIEADLASTDSGSGLGGFLKGQLGMRSLAPRDGDSADAVLSRAEARLRDGDLKQAMGEIDTLGGAAADALSAWRERARNRLNALAAFQALADRVTN